MGEEEHKRHIIKLAGEDFTKLDDGFIYFWPAEARGCYSAYNLRVIADELDRQNKPQQDAIDAYFAAWKAKKAEAIHEEST